ncbi:MAG: zf-HC2 domain-containing protein [Acidobacteriota bacterium]
MMTRERQDPWTGRLSEYLDDELSALERRRLDRHLAACTECRATLEALREIARKAPHLAVDTEPARDLWPGIAARLTARRAPWWRRVLRPPALSPGRLAYAATAILAIVAIGAIVLWVRSTQGTSDVTRQAAGPAGAPAAPPVPAGRAYDDEVANLRRIVSRTLTADPSVIAVLDRNLDSLDVAIADYQDALARNPGDQRLRQRLAAARERKLAMLQRIATLAESGAN